MKINIKQIPVQLYLFALMLYLFRQGMNTTMYSIAWPQWYDMTVRIIAAMAFAMRLYTERLYKDKRLYLALIASAVFGLSYMHVGYDFLLDMAIFFVGAVGIDYRKIVRNGIYVGAVTVALPLIGSATGCVTNLTYEMRNSMGFVYPTDAQARIFFLCVLCLVYFTEVPLIIHSIAYGLLAVILYKITEARCATIGLIMLCVMSFSLWLWQSVCKATNVHPALGAIWERIRRIFVNIFKCALIILMPIQAAIMIAGTWFYDADNELWFKINQILSTRLALGQEALKNYGITLLGTAFDQIGNGGGGGYNPAYNFVDSSYVLLAVRYGILVLIAVCIIYMVSMYKAMKSKNVRFAIGLIAIATTSMIEHHLIELAYNTLIPVAAANVMPWKSLHKERKGAQQDNAGEPCQEMKEHQSDAANKRLTYSIISCILMALYWLYIIPKLSVIGRISLWSEGAYNVKAMLYFLVLILIMLISRYILVYFKKSRLKTILTACIVLGFGALTAAVNYRYSAGYECFEEEMQADGEILDMLSEIVANNNAQIYVEALSSLYKKQYPIVDNLYYPKEYLAFMPGNNTLITDSNNDIEPLNLSGYVYTEVSDLKAIYTNDEVVIDAMTEMGYTFTPYCSKLKDVTETMKALNYFMLNEDGELILTNENQMVYGPYVNLNQGTYLIVYDFELIEAGETEDDSHILQLNISYNYGQNDWGILNYTKDTFYENNKAKIRLAYDIGNKRYSAVEFKAYCTPGTVIRINEVYYRRVS